MLEAFLTSTLLVAVAEIGDKTQLLSFVLAARLRNPVAICSGIFVATILNHALAGSAGAVLARFLGPEIMRWVVGVGFLAFALWTLKPDSLDADPTSQGGAFATTLVAFFFAEMGDKTQLATVALAARFPSLPAIVLGTTVGMMLANVPAVLIGERLADRLPLRPIRWTAAALFAAFGLATLLGLGS